MLTILGTVNTASRMESNSEKNRILCSKAAADALQEQNCEFIITPRGEIPIKGKGNMLTYWIHDEVERRKPERWSNNMVKETSIKEDTCQPGGGWTNEMEV